MNKIEEAELAVHKVFAFRYFVYCFIVALVFLRASPIVAQNTEKPPTIVTTDDEVDDMESLSFDEQKAEMLKFSVPDDAEHGQTIHMIIQAVDNGIHDLTVFRRVVINVK